MKSELIDLFEALEGKYTDFKNFNKKIEIMKNELEKRQFTSYM